MYYCFKCGKKLTEDEEEFCSQCRVEGFDFAEPDEEEEPEVAAQAARKRRLAALKPWLGLRPFGLSLICFFCVELSVSRYHPLADIFGYPFGPRSHFFAVATPVVVFFTLDPKKRRFYSVMLILSFLWAVYVSFEFLNTIGDFVVILVVGFILSYLGFARGYVRG
jgi:hypothetical protein